MVLIELINKTIAIGAIISQIFIVAVVVYVLFFRKQYRIVGDFLGKRGLLLAFLVSLGSVIGSLFYSNVVGFEPCNLCWFQRIFMYPLVVLLGLALIKKPARNALGIIDAGGDRSIVDYALSLSVIGFLISLYQNYLYYSNSGLSAWCQTFSGGASCIKRYVFEFGYITIPLMALTAFSLVIIFLLFSKMRKSEIKN